MNFKVFLISFCFLIYFVIANKNLLVSIEFENEIEIPQGWKIKDFKPNPNLELKITLALKQNNIEYLNNLFWEVSNPESKNYGKYLTNEQVNNLIRPKIETRETILNWLFENSIEIFEETKAQDFINIKLTLEKAENLLNCKFYSFEHILSRKNLIRTLKYSVPFKIAKELDFIGGTIHFPKIKIASKSLRQQFNNNNHRSLINPTSSKVDPATIKQRYNISAQDIGISNSNTQAVHQFLEQYYSPKDLSKFFNQFGLPDNAVTRVVGPNDPSKPGTEASLDIEYIMATATDVSTWFFYTDGYDNGNQEPFLEWIISLTNMTDAPLVNSVSYGDEESSISDSYLDRCDTQFQLFGVQGRTLLFASGDSGVGCKKCSLFVPDWPSSSPYVTSVGGTELNVNNEIGVTFSGGGFSNHFARPSYQDSAVLNYLSTTNNLPDQSFYNNTGRAYPDLSAVATNYQIVVRGFTTLVDGTSCSTPTVAGIIALLNDIRLQRNQPSLGFLNPWLYQTVAKVPGALYDVTQGRNANGCCDGFPATVGWDPMTGLGTPNFAVLKGIV
eukprot:TRINITY_DN4_c0_g1_i6.p1 TRINITY_DN4_c0_g1~~TRINITY_DN4_c0_g1_i6.p1  ORF type:complete len:577 (-),score=307.42 TRINITY_DN4_c0_g1_i6:166-1836(-)